MTKLENKLKALRKEAHGRSRASSSESGRHGCITGFGQVRSHIKSSAGAFPVQVLTFLHTLAYKGHVSKATCNMSMEAHSRTFPSPEGQLPLGFFCWSPGGRRSGRSARGCSGGAQPPGALDLGLLVLFGSYSWDIP